jgi:hypothetical protein
MPKEGRSIAAAFPGLARVGGEFDALGGSASPWRVVQCRVEWTAVQTRMNFLFVGRGQGVDLARRDEAW